jgi:rhodanese-related sulfurtransferase
LIGAGCKEVKNILGGHISLQRFAATGGFRHINMIPLPIAKKSISEKVLVETENNNNISAGELERLVVDVRTPGEFMSGAFPDAINIPLDEIMSGGGELGTHMDREIVVYCATGARSAYAKQILRNRGYSNVTDGGGISSMMSRY